MTSTVPGKALIQLAMIVIALTAIFTTAHAQDSKPTVYKIVEAGVQVDLPSGWNSSKDKDGTYLIVKKDGDAYVLYSLSVLPRDKSMTIDMLYAAFSEGIFENAKKDWKGFKPGEVMKNTQDGMAIRAQKIDGSVADAGGDLEGLVIVIDSPTPLGIFAQRTRKHSDLLEKESEAILSSIKKIQ